MTEAAKHTPGPWHVVIGRLNPDDPAYGFGIFPDKPTLTNLPSNVRQHSLASGNLYEHSSFSAFYPPEVIEANARLIAAAPDMLAALKQLNHTTRNGVLDDARRAEFNVAFKVARDAIAKAEGRS